MKVSVANIAILLAFCENNKASFAIDDGGRTMGVTFPEIGGSLINFEIVDTPTARFNLLLGRPVIQSVEKLIDPTGVELLTTINENVLMSDVNANTIITGAVAGGAIGDFDFWKEVSSTDELMEALLKQNFFIDADTKERTVVVNDKVRAKIDGNISVLCYCGRLTIDSEFEVGAASVVTFESSFKASGVPSDE